MCLGLGEEEEKKVSFFPFSFGRPRRRPRPLSLSLSLSKKKKKKKKKTTPHFVDRHAVPVGHLVELVDADDAAIGQDHGACFQPLLPGVLVGGDRGG